MRDTDIDLTNPPTTLEIGKGITLPCDVPSVDNPQDLVNYIWNWVNGVWLPQYGNIPHGDNYIRFKDTNQEHGAHYADLALVTDLGIGGYDPLLVWSQGMIVKKDFSAGGFVTANQGLIALGSAMKDTFDPPGIWLIHSDHGALFQIEERTAAQGDPTPPTGGHINDRPYFINLDARMGRLANHLYQWNGSTWVDRGHRDSYNYNMDTAYVRRAQYSVILNPEHLDGPPDSPAYLQCYYNNSDGHIKRWQYVGATQQWVDMGSFVPNLPIQLYDQGHLACHDLHAANVYPQVTQTGGLGEPGHVWQGAMIQTVYTEAIKHLNGSDWSFPSIQKGSVNTDASGVANITFPQAFASTPSITCTAVDSSGRHIAVVITAQSATQFSIKSTVTGDHKHKVGDIFGTDNFALGIDSVGDHTHSFSAGAHTHMIGTISATVGWSMGIDSQGNHNHTVVGTTGVGGAHNHTVVGTTGSGSSHYHGMQNHTHSMTGGSGSANTGTTSGHYHSYTYYYVSGWVTGGPSNNSTQNESSHTHYYSGYSSDVDNHTHYYSGYSGDNGSHSHNLTNKPPYVRDLMMRDSNGTQHDLGGILTNTSDSQFDLYTLSSSSGGTTGSAGGHTHNLTNKPAYTRGVSLRNSSGGSFTIGGVLANDPVVGTTEAHTETTNPASNIAIAVNWIAVG
jgi:hypothetical protein